MVFPFRLAVLRVRSLDAVSARLSLLDLPKATTRRGLLSTRGCYVIERFCGQINLGNPGLNQVKQVSSLWNFSESLMCLICISSLPKGQRETAFLPNLLDHRASVDGPRPATLWKPRSTQCVSTWVSVSSEGLVTCRCLGSLRGFLHF